MKIYIKVKIDADLLFKINLKALNTYNLALLILRIIKNFVYPKY